MSNVVVKVEGLGKRYRLGSKKSGSFREAFTQFWNTRKRSEDFWALRDLSFEIKKGEAVGIIGKNGAGKSTLLKILSRITEPTTGRVTIDGRLASLLEVGTGFHPELTGRENIFMNGTILGMRKREIREKFDEIVAFSGVENFIDTPVKHYSSGMHVRLAFSVAAHLEPEILIVDEVLAVGDADFQKKCLGKMNSVADEGRTVLFVSHNMAALRALCSKAIYLQDGSMKNIGPTEKIIDQYLDSSTTGISNKIISPSDLDVTDTSFIEVRDICIQLAEGKRDFVPQPKDSLEIGVEFVAKRNIHGLRFMIFLEDNKNTMIFSYSSEEITKELKKDQKYNILFKFQSHLFLPNKYQITMSAGIPGRVKIIDRTKLLSLLVNDDGLINNRYNGYNEGLIYPQIRCELNSEI